jgi:hypothetical protein
VQGRNNRDGDLGAAQLSVLGRQALRSALEFGHLRDRRRLARYCGCRFGVGCGQLRLGLREALGGQNDILAGLEVNKKESKEEEEEVEVEESEKRRKEKSGHRPRKKERQELKDESHFGIPPRRQLARALLTAACVAAALSSASTWAWLAAAAASLAASFSASAAPPAAAASTAACEAAASFFRWANCETNS